MKKKQGRYKPGSRDIPEAEKVKRFWSRVATAGNDDCWLWTAAKHTQGYGLCSYRPNARAHRVAWELTKGPIPPGMMVCHKCDNPPCCNPNHLFIGTNTDNVVDMELKRRSKHVKGESHGASKLSEADVAEIRRRYKPRVGHRPNSGVSQKKLAEEYGVHRATIQLILSGKNWKHIPVEITETQFTPQITHES
jgi:hypothetical protein